MAGRRVVHREARRQAVPGGPDGRKRRLRSGEIEVDVPRQRPAGAVPAQQGAVGQDVVDAERAQVGVDGAEERRELARLGGAVRPAERRAPVAQVPPEHAQVALPSGQDLGGCRKHRSQSRGRENPAQPFLEPALPRCSYQPLA